MIGRHGVRRFVVMQLTAGLALFIAQANASTALAKATKRSKSIPLADFFRNPQVTDFKISPNGRILAYLSPWKHRLNLFVRPVHGIHFRRLTSITDRDIASYFWKGNRTLLFLRDFNGDKNFQLFAVNLLNRRVKDLTPFPGVRAEIIKGSFARRGPFILIGLNKRDRHVFDVYRVNIRTGALKQIAQNPGDISSWLADHRGRLRLAVATDGLKRSILVRDRESQPFRKILTTDFRTKIYPLMFTFDDRNVYALSDRGRDKQALVILNLKSGKQNEIYGRKDVDIDGFAYSLRHHRLWFAAYRTWKTRRHFFDRAIARMFATLAKKIHGLDIQIVSRDWRENKFVIFGSSDKDPGRYFLYIRKSNSLSKLGDIQPWIKPELMSATRPIVYAARDGLPIHGYLTLPRNAPKAKHLPSIVLLHGGPWLRDSWQYNPEVQFFASRGYAVLQVNFRGSTGYGRKFWEASFGEWGRKVQDDITDGVTWLIHQGVADPNRIAIYGGSFGGYAALAGLTFTPNLYACGVDAEGISDIAAFMQNVSPLWRLRLRSFDVEIGNPKTQKSLLRAESPIYSANKIKSPVFISYGTNDPVVPISQSRRMIRVLQSLGKKVTYLAIKNEGHGFHDVEHRMKYYSALEKFLKSCL